MGLRFFRRINYKRAERKILERFRRTARRTVSSIMFYFRASVTRECYPSRDTSQWYRRIFCIFIRVFFPFAVQISLKIKVERDPVTIFRIHERFQQSRLTLISEIYYIFIFF